MSAPARTTQPSRAEIMKVTREANLPAGVIPPAAQAMISERKLRNAMAAKIRGTQWGINDQRTAMAVADYCFANRIDPIRHIEVLGGRIYLKAEFYQEEGARLIAADKVTSIDVDHVEHDERLDVAYLEGVKFADEAQQGGQADEAKFWTEQANEARREIARRRNLRIRHGAKEKAAAVVVITIRVPVLEEPIVGWNECGGEIRKGDPVGDARPALTAETRAARRAWRQLCDVVPSIAPRVLLAEEEGAALEEIIAEGRRLSAGDEIEHSPAGVVRTDDPYGEVSTPATEPAAATATPDEDLLLDQQLMADEARAASPPGSKRVDVPKPGRVQDSFPLGDEPKRRGTDALREG